MNEFAACCHKPNPANRPLDFFFYPSPSLITINSVLAPGEAESESHVHVRVCARIVHV